MTKRQIFGDMLAHIVAERIGTWRFVFWQFMVMCAWIAWNVWSLAHRFDPYPFVFGNLAMSAEAAFTGPILLIAAKYERRRDEEHARRVDHQLSEILRLLKRN